MRILVLTLRRQLAHLRAVKQADVHTAPVRVEARQEIRRSGGRAVGSAPQSQSVAKDHWGELAGVENVDVGTPLLLIQTFRTIPVAIAGSDVDRRRIHLCKRVT